MFRPALARCSRATSAIRTRRRDHRRAEGPQAVGRQRGLRPQRQRAGDGDANAFDRELVRPRTIKRRPSASWASGARAHRLDIKLDYLPASTTPRSVATADRPTVRDGLLPLWRSSSNSVSVASHATRQSRRRAVAASSCCCFRRGNERVVGRRLGNRCARHATVPLGARLVLASHAKQVSEESMLTLRGLSQGHWADRYELPWDLRPEPPLRVPVGF
jgi:hypothetical protein